VGHVLVRADRCIADPIRSDHLLIELSLRELVTGASAAARLPQVALEERGGVIEQAFETVLEDRRSVPVTYRFDGEMVPNRR
jgi:hypothetical protein